MTDKEIEATTAHLNREDTLKVKDHMEGGYLELGRLLKECRDKRYYNALGYGTFGAYCGDADLTISKSKAYEMISIYEQYVLRMGVPPQDLAGIGSSKLSIISPVVDLAPEEWMDKAKSLGKMDLINEVRNAQGKGDMPPVQPDGRDLSAQSWKNFEAFKKAAGCAIDGNPEVEKAHYPSSRGASAPEDAWIPLCHRCHADLHQRGVDTWTAENKRNLWKWVHSTLERAYGIGRDK